MTPPGRQERLAPPLRTRLASFDESGMDYWRVVATLRDGRRFGNVYITGAFTLGFPALCPFRAGDVIAVDWEGFRGGDSSGAPVLLGDGPDAGMLRASYEREVRRLIAALTELAHSLEADAPDARSRQVFAPVAARLLIATGHLRGAIEAGATRRALADISAELAAPLEEIRAASTKGDVPLARPELLEEALALRVVFREARFSSIA